MKHNSGMKRPSAKPGITFSSDTALSRDQGPEAREYMHELKLKGAISRQELAKAQREHSLLQDDVGKLEEELGKLERTLDIDERYLLKQEEELSSIQTAVSLPPERLVEQVKDLSQEIDLSKRSVVEIRKFHEREINLCIQTQEEQERLKESLNRGNLTEALSLMKQQIQLYENQLECKEKAGSIIEDRYQKHLEILENEKRDLERTLEEVKTQRVADQRTLYDMERRLAYLENDAKVSKLDSGTKSTEQVAIQAAEQVLGKLKERLSSTSSSQPIIEKIDSQVNKNKSRTVNLYCAPKSQT